MSALPIPLSCVKSLKRPVEIYLDKSMQSLRISICVTGQVQGVGFRPFVYALAGSFGLTGFVRNGPEGVVIEVQGRKSALDEFCLALVQEAPVAARPGEIKGREIAFLDGEDDFVIRPSNAVGERTALICPDLAPCPRCIEDIRQPKNRRRKYAFTNCTACGPRFTITAGLPYDRQNTSMDVFPMCARCREEYQNPRDRRFHAQPNACPQCGPHLWLVCTGPGGAPALGLEGGEATHEAALRGAAHLVRAGKIVALKGVGGFQLTCDASWPPAVKELRRRKNRRDKPLAMMIRSLEDAEKLSVLSPEEKALLSSPAAPIVLCRLRPEARFLFDPDVSPDTLLVGLMLPSSPLHHIFMDEYARLLPEGKFPLLVMTSGNQSQAPLCSDNNFALSGLKGIADAFLLHNRDIYQPTDDSVIRHIPGLPGQAGAESPVMFIRRARGYVPEPLELFKSDKRLPVILGVGADVKNTLCIAHRDQAFVSQHIGDMENLEAMDSHRNICKRLCNLLRVKPQVVVHDAHPGYLSNVLAEEHCLPVETLQHHFAHAHAVLAEHGHQGPALAVTLDGTGYGLDGSIWGGEVLLVDTETLEHKRLGHMSPLLLPGGESAIREPWRVAHGLIQFLGLPAAKNLPWLEEQASAVPLVSQMVRIKVNSPESTSCGRLFDAVSALLGLCQVNRYEGQAAVILEQAQEREGRAEGRIPGAYPCPFVAPASEGGEYVLDTHSLFRSVYADWVENTPVALVSQRFHLGLTLGLADLCLHLSQKTGIRQVGLSGGSFQNATLTRLLAGELHSRGLVPLLHRRLPPNDACISFGQAAWCRQKMIRQGGWR